MAARIISKNDKEFIVQTTISYSRDMLEFEENVQVAVNEMGVVATKEGLEKFDTDGTAIKIGNDKYTSKGKKPKKYQTPYGEISVERHVYQSSKGGATYCPLEERARIIITSTPRFSKIVSSKYSDLGSLRVITDLEENHGRKVVRSFVQDIAEAIGTIINTKEKEWTYDIPELDEDIKSISIGLDGTCMILCEDGYREAMVGTVAMFDKDGERKHTIYTAASPEYGKEKFFNKLEMEIEKVKKKYPDVIYVGIADGAKGNWEFLEKHTDIQTLDFWHVIGYVGKVSGVMFKGKRKAKEKQKWLDEMCHELKHVAGTADKLLKEMVKHENSHKLNNSDEETIQSAITYFSNHKHQMAYSENIANKLPIGSGITEAACKVIVKQRLCNSGMKWKDKGASIVLSLRCMNYSVGRWSQFWDKISQYGLPMLT